MKITGSALPLLRKCQWWARPEVEAPPQPPSNAMVVGTEVHAAIESVLGGKAVSDISPEARDFLATWAEWWATLPLGATGYWQPEAAFAYDPSTDTARKLEVKARAYDVAPHEIAGTVDAMLVDGASAIVADWKVGVDFHGLTADAAENWQLRFYALAAARAYNLDSVKIAVVRITPFGVKHSDYSLDAMELDAVAAEVGALYARAAASTPNPGLHCRRCKAVAVCPTTQTAIEKTQPATLTIENAEQATAALMRLRQVQAACEQMEVMLKAWAEKNEGIPLPNGKRWVKVPMERENISLTGDNMAAGLAAISAIGALDAVESKATTSRAAIERNLKAQGLKGKELKAKMEAFLDDLRNSGVLKSVAIDAWREVE